MLESPQAFLADFGVPVVFGALVKSAILDTVGNDVVGGRASSVDYLLTYITADLPGLGYGSAITVNGVSFKVLSTRLQNDGTFSVAQLEAV